MKHIVSVEWLAERLTHEDVVIVDTRFQLGQPEAGREAYETSHIPGAVYLDLERDLSAPIGEHGGRHPLPDTQELAEKLGQSGISNQSIVVAYDDQGGAMASRLWWLLRYLGHDQVYVLEAGYTVWQEAGLPVSEAQLSYAAAQFVPQLRPELVVDAAYVRERIGQPGTILIDSREAPRYRGEHEPIDKAAGHIPGARNKFWKEVLTADGRFKSQPELEQSFATLPKDQQLIVYCGSGVTATPNVLGLSEAGYGNVKLYAGSWSDWSSNPDNPVTVGDEEKA